MSTCYLELILYVTILLNLVMSILVCLSWVSTASVELCINCTMQCKLEDANLLTSTGETMSVHVKTTDGLRQVWSSTRHDGEWAHQYVDLGRVDADQFTVIFHVRFGSWCRMSVGLDNVKFHTCAVGEWAASRCLILASL